MAGLVLSEVCEEGSVRCLLLLLSNGLLATIDFPWFIEAWPQSVSSSSPGILPVCMSFSRFPLFYKDSNHVGLEDHATAVWTSQVAIVVKNLPANAGDARDACLIPGSGRFPWRRAWQSTPVFLPGESHRQRRWTGYSPWGHKELDTTEHTALLQYHLILT